MNPSEAVGAEREDPDEAPGRAAGPSGEGFAELLDSFREQLDQRLLTFLERKRRSRSGRGDPGELMEGVARLVRGGGKRLRPALVYHAYRSCGGRSEDTVMPLAMAVELFHTYLLVHDDVMDRSELRRGVTTSQVLFADRHVSRGWPGDADHFGRSAALLVGDLAHGWAVELLHRVDADGDRGRRLRRAFSSMSERVVLGQYRETVLSHRGDATEEELLEVLRLKSGGYSVERPVEMGAILAGASPARVDVLRRWGRAVGLAFQLQDDILGTFGDADRAGKPGASDLREGKMTLLVHTALRRAPEEEAEELRDVLLDPSPDPDDVVRGRAVIRSSGAVRRVRSLVARRLEEAVELARSAFEDPVDRAFFSELPRHLRGRER